MRPFVSFLGTLILLANLACAALCAAPPHAPHKQPPCHQQHEDAQPKVCDQQTSANDAVKTILPAMGEIHFFPPPVSFVLLATAFHQPPAASPKPPLVLRI